MESFSIEDVTGLSYESAKSRMAILQAEIDQYTNHGFEDVESCSAWAKDHVLDIIVYSNSNKMHFNLTHLGKMVPPTEFIRIYGSDLLYTEFEHKGKIARIPWKPTGHRYYSNARVAGETGDGVLRPLHHRNYFTPTGFFDNDKGGTFNVAIPFPAFAKRTGRDTSHIYTYINHVATTCAPYLLAWLREKCLNPYAKTQVAPIISSRQQGTGKTTFVDVICAGLFGKDNVLVTDKFDTSSKFNSDYADKLVVSVEEKDETDKRVDASSLKSMITASTIRKEYKGIDPVIQQSYTEFVVTTNKDVAIKFDSEDQRRFMMVDVDADFHVYSPGDQAKGFKMSEKNKLAEEVFAKLYGLNRRTGEVVGTPFTEDKELIEQFKYELLTSKEIAAVNPRDFPRDTAAAMRCFSLPRTSESAEIEMIMRNLAPFIKESLVQKKVIALVGEETLANYLSSPAAIEFMPRIGPFPEVVALCRPLVFYDQSNGKPFKLYR